MSHETLYINKYTDEDKPSEVYIEAQFWHEKQLDFLLHQLDSAYIEMRDELKRLNQRGRNERVGL